MTQTKTLVGFCTALVVIALLAVTTGAQMPQTTTERTKGTPTVVTEKMTGQVVLVEGNTLVVKMASGEIRTFTNVPDSRKAIIDGKEVGVRDLQPGTKLTATVSKTTTPVTVRTTTVGTGKVMWVAGTTVILTLPNGENKQYTVKKDYKFVIDGKPATVYDLKPGMTVSAEKIVEAPTVEIATNTEVVGQAPRPRPAAPATQAAAPAAGATERANAATLTPETAQATAPAKLPKTGSPLPLVGLLGFLFVGGSYVVGRIRS